MKLTITLALLGGIGAWAAEPTPLEMKTGEWEYTVTMQMAGMPAATQMPQIPPEVLDKMTPEQRAQMQKAMGAMSGKPTVNRNCVKKEDLSNFNPTNMAKDCKMTVTNSSRSKFEATVVCDTPGNKATANITAEVLNSESMKFSVVSKGTTNGQPGNMTINGTGKWLGATCTDEK